MNVHAKILRVGSPQDRPGERQRRRFTIDEVLAMERAGILGEDEHVELIDGDLIAMPAKGNRHEDMRTLLAEVFSDHSAGKLRIAQEPAFHLSQHFNPEPDILVFPRSLRVYEVRGDTALLVVEVADTSLSTDLTTKALMYAAHGVREYWVVDALRIETHVHRDPRPDGYGSVLKHAAGESLTPLLVAGVSVRLAELGLEPLTEDEGGSPAAGTGDPESA